ncbi:MAG: LptF/LptG family permease [Phycisphaerae bacterium]|nr:LptF/LptG family permease [Phycisphaerae bacterium]
MITIDRYLVKTFLSSYVLLMLIGIALYVFSDVIVNLDEFTEDPDLTATGVLLKIADFHGYRMPLYFHQLGGVTMAIAASFTFALLLRNNELTPLVAAGVPLQRLAVPVILSSVVLVVLWFVNSELIVPAYAAKIVRHYDDLGKTRQVEVLCVRDDHNAVLSAAELNAQQGWLKEVYIIEPDENGNPTHLISADYAHYDHERQTWNLGQRGSRLTIGAAFESGDLGGTIQREAMREYPFTLSPDQILLRQSSYWADLMSMRQMSGLLQSDNLPNLPAVAKSRDIRFSQPLLIWILILLTVPYFLTREPTNVLVAGGKALLLGGVCFGFTFLAHSISTEVRFAPLATALPVLIFGPASVLHLANVKT